MSGCNTDPDFWPRTLRVFLTFLLGIGGTICRFGNLGAGMATFFSCLNPGTEVLGSLYRIRTVRFKIFT